jgi:hypothetical protein
MTAQHTAGPWFSGGTFANCVFGPDGRLVADATQHNRGMRMAIANARLIASAPDLLEALRPLAALDLPATPSGNAGAYSIRHSDILVAVAAIAKATGAA